MSSQQLGITLHGAGANDGRGSVWVNLEQDIAAMPGRLTFFDLAQMLGMARSGLSAWAYEGNSCPLTVNDDGTVTISLGFYSWPSSLDLPYTVTANIGELREWEVAEVEREFDLVIPETDLVELPFILSGAVIEWQTPAFDRNWKQIRPPAITLDEGNLRLSESCFGVLRVNGTAIGYRHVVDINIEREKARLNDAGVVEVETYRIENLQCSVTAHWEEDGVSKFAKEKLEIPDCVAEYLATCANGQPRHSEVLITPEGKRRTIVYYNDCAGTVIMVWTDRESDA